MDGRAIPDVLIVGGGLVGPALALALAQGGFRVTLADRVPARRRADPGFDGRAYAIALGSERLLAAIGVWDRIAERAQPIEDIHVSEGLADPAGQGALHFDPRELDEGRFGWIVEDRWLRGALLDAVAREGAIEHRAPVAVEAVEPGPAHALAESDGAGALEARLVVAADGRRSPLAAAAGIDRIGWRYDQIGLVGAIAHELPHHGLAHQSFFPGGPFAVLPLPGNRSSIVWSERTAKAKLIQGLDDAGYLAELRRRIGPRLGAVELAGRRWSYPLDLSLAERYVAPRLALVGDAAHGVHPLAGQGMNMGLRDVAALAEVLVEAARRGEDIGTLPVLERYQRWRRFDAAAFALGMDALNRLFSNAAGPLPAIRSAALMAVGRLGGLRRMFMREAAGTAGDVPRLLRGQPL